MHFACQMRSCDVSEGFEVSPTAGNAGTRIRFASCLNGSGRLTSRGRSLANLNFRTGCRCCCKNRQSAG